MEDEHYEISSSDGKKSFNFFSHAICAGEFPIVIWCIGFSDGGLMHTSHLVNIRRKTGRERRGWKCTKSRQNGSRPGVYVHFHFDASSAFHPYCWSCESFGNKIRGVTKPGGDGGLVWNRKYEERVIYVWEKTRWF